MNNKGDNLYNLLNSIKSEYYIWNSLFYFIFIVYVFVNIYIYIYKPFISKIIIKTKSLRNIKYENMKKNEPRIMNKGY